MRQSIRILCLFMLFFIITTGLRAQVIIGSSGGDVVNETGSMTVTIGQAFMSSAEGPEGSIIQGVQIPNELLGVGVNEIPLSALNIKMTVFPNPTTDFVNLRIEDDDFYSKSYRYYLYRLDGSFMKTERITSDIIKIDLSNYAAHSYLLKIVGNNQNYELFKITKSSK